MPFVAAKCTRCGANLHVDSSNEATICNHCGTPFITEKAINNFNITNNISTPMVSVFGGDTADVLYNRALEWLRLRNETKAIQVLCEMTEKYPGDIRGWSKLAHLCSDNVIYMENAAALGDEGFKEKCRQREQKAIAMCFDIRNGHGEKWINSSHYLFGDAQYNTLTCVKDLLNEGIENATYLSNRITALGWPDITQYTDVIGKIWGAHDALHHVRNDAKIIIGNLVFWWYDSELFCKTCNQIITKAAIDNTFSTIGYRKANTLCLCCGKTLNHSDVKTFRHKDGKSRYYECANCNHRQTGAI